MKKTFKNLLWHLSEKLRIGEIKRDVTSIQWLLVDQYLQTHLFQNPKYADPRRLSRHEYKIYSQSGEDGIIDEIFKRIGTTTRTFVEFGIGDGFENNTLALLAGGWHGYWMDGNEKAIAAINTSHKRFIESKQLVVKKAFITAENIQSLFAEIQVPREIDLLSIDIDGNDYWVWKAITDYKPRVVVIEYNGVFPSHMEKVVRYESDYMWGRSSLYGSPLKAFETLAEQKGYSLVGCCFVGNNAFFVRNDLLGEKFLAPYTAETHYEPFRHFLLQKPKYDRSLVDLVDL